MATYIRSLIDKQNGLKRVPHLAGVTAPTLTTAKLDTLCSQWELVRLQMCFKGFKNVFLDYLTQINIATTERLVAVLNMASPNPTTKLPHNATAAQLVGPLVLMHLIDHMWLLVIEPVQPTQIKHYT